MNRAFFLLLALSLTPSAFSQPTERGYLSGRGKDDAVPWRFLCTTGAHSGYWTNIPVPSNWELQGFGTLNYKKDSTNAWDEKGLYQRDFKVPSAWKGRRVFLVFEGAMTDTSAKLNGRSVGPTHQGGFYRFKYEVTSLLRFDSANRLEVTVAKHSANKSVNDAERLADYWVFGGIYRPVYLEAVPQQFIDRVAVNAQADGAFTMNVFTLGGTRADTLEAQITDLDGKPVGAPFSATLTNFMTVLQTRIDSPRLWSAETPNLYRVDVRLKEKDKVIHFFQQRFGFRTMEVRDGDGLYVNGRRVILKGVNRHSFWPESGRCLSEAVHRLDIQTMKDMNMNAVRMSHYPPDAEFLDLCDELGLYVLDELAGWHHYYETSLGEQLVAEMVARDVNHPSILFWCNGDEGGFNYDLDPVFQVFDPQRRRVLHPWASDSGLCTAHYLAYDKAAIAGTGKSVYYAELGEHVATNDHNRYIYMPTEFQHALYDGGGGASLADYWNLMLQSPVAGGGFIWAFLDDGVKRPDTGEIDLAGNQAPDGVVGPYRQREASFYAIKEIWSPIVINQSNITSQFTGTLPVENRFSFTDASQCKFTWQLRKFRGPGEKAAGFKVVKEGRADAPHIPPGGKGLLELQLPFRWYDVDALALRVDDPTGRELWTHVWALPHPDDTRQLATARAKSPATVAETDDTIDITAGKLGVTISKKTGFLAQVRRGSKSFSFANGPRPVVGEAKLKSIGQTTNDTDVIVTAAFDGELDTVTWRVRGNGWVQCDYTYHAAGTNDAVGVVFDYPESLVLKKKWLGDGPYRVWKNRLEGVTLNVWENDYNDTITGYSKWIYPEFKGCFANVRWMQLETKEGLITAVPGRNDGFVQVLSPGLPPEKLYGKTSFKLPQAGLAFLDAIPPVGSKFKTPDQLGPQGQPNVTDGSYSGSVSFYFGKLP